MDGLLLFSFVLLNKYCLLMLTAAIIIASNLASRTKTEQESYLFFVGEKALIIVYHIYK